MPRKSYLSDVNEELIETYRADRDDASAIIARLRRQPVSSEHFYAVRASAPRTRIGRAVRMLYLNRTAFSGMYRLNADGEFNVPYGGGERTPKLLFESDILIRAAYLLRNVRLKRCSFEIALSLANFGDVVYCDARNAEAITNQWQGPN